MSTGASCSFREKSPGQWFYELQRYPYGATEEYDVFGPFRTFKAAYDHLHRNHANPGGFWSEALPGCPHDMVQRLEFRLDENDYTHTCDRCGEFLRMRPNGTFTDSNARERGAHSRVPTE